MPPVRRRPPGRGAAVRSRISPSSAAVCGAGTPTRSAISSTAPVMHSISSGLPDSRSCSIEVRWSPTLIAPCSRRSIETGSVMPSAAPTAATSSITARATSVLCGVSAISPRVAPVSAVVGLKATLPTSFSHSSRRTSSSTGQRSPPAAKPPRWPGSAR